ncbi:hypothetical protein PPACK8108_LOCUS19019 [Phakopsora pachyrhizi]|uniref:Uncharacterized protein n=1 Tax=Phakopsora pachyrhizi TaxID=170000 RepID=A0AAV0BBF0_PHAPC|nr:hypothetical protein PPACK8108_LOCUS19019 [Phakopsora pachyrhizi]
MLNPLGLVTRAYHYVRNTDLRSLSTFDYSRYSAGECPEVRLENGQSQHHQETLSKSSISVVAGIEGGKDLDLGKGLDYEQKRQDKIAAAFISNCSPTNNREKVLAELIELLPGKIDSFGGCIQNANTTEVLEKLNLLVEEKTLSKWEEKTKKVLSSA